MRLTLRSPEFASVCKWEHRLKQLGHFFLVKGLATVAKEEFHEKVEI